MVRTLLPFKAIAAFVITLSIFLVFGFSTEAAASSNDIVNKTLVWPDGTRYVGEVRNGKRWGKGTIFWNDGTRFVGTFANDLRNGPGTMILPDGSVYNGYFENDALVDTPATTPISDRVADQQVVTKSPATIEITPIDVTTTNTGKVTTKPAIEPTQAKPAIIDTIDTPAISTPDRNIPIVAAEESVTEEDLNIGTSALPLNLDVNELSESVRTDIESMIDLWAAAWSDKNVVQYLAYYSEDFNVPGKQSRRQWEALRRSRLQKPKSINVSIDYEKIEITSTNSARVIFNQRYESNIFSDKTRKEFILKKEGEFWLITSERSL